MANTLDFEPALVPIRAREDSTISWPLSFVDEAGAALNMTGRTFTSQITDKAGDAVLVTGSFDYTDVATGIIVVNMNLGPLSPGEYVWDLWEDTGATLDPLLGGPVFISKRVTT